MTLDVTEILRFYLDDTTGNEGATDGKEIKKSLAGGELTLPPARDALLPGTDSPPPEDV